MRIYSMTATFGKLEHRTLTLSPGLNVIEAPNEWGKSTWCAFLMAMLYGLDTRERSRKDALADKERFAPWSGSPMSGRIDLCWQGRDITIERRSKGRIPMGELIAYETATGIPVPELTAGNCGQVLLGVERSVYARTGAIRSTDMPVTQDDALRHRLNALVTTGDESGAAEALEQKLRDLKNRIRYNRKGLLPEAEAERSALIDKLRDYDRLVCQSQQLRLRRQELDHTIHTLKNHIAALDHSRAQADALRIAAAAEARDTAAATLQTAENACRELPQRQQAEDALRHRRELHRRWDSLLEEERALPDAPQPPQVSEAFRGMTPADAVHQAQTDKAAMERLPTPTPALGLLPGLLGLAIAAIGIFLTLKELLLPGLLLAAAGLSIAAVGFLSIHRHRSRQTALDTQRQTLCRRYGSDDPTLWVMEAERYRADWDAYRQAYTAFRASRETLDQRRLALRQQLDALPADDPAETLRAWDALAQAQAHYHQATQHLHALRSMAKSAPPAPEPDDLSWSAPQTQRLLDEAVSEQDRIVGQLGQCQGQMSLLGTREDLTRQIDALEERISRLELTGAALEQGLHALSQARDRLRRRFAPRICKRAQELFSQLTLGRYDRLVLTPDLSVDTAAHDEDTLHSHLWRSEGTADQIYLALRLAMAQELTPHAPLILDDALIRFDRDRLDSAMQVLRHIAQDTQVIVFTCRDLGN